MRAHTPGSGYRSAQARRTLHGFVLSLALGTGALAQEAPHAQFATNPSPAKGEERLVVQFLDRSTGTITSWNWDFGDGTGSTLQNPAHLYLFGKFDVSLTVRGPGGADTTVLDSAVEVLLPPPTALATMPVPLPAELGAFVRDMDQAIALGKALFWDVQVGSDGLTACASCHYQAGADGRARNTLHPGANGRFDRLPSGRQAGPNLALTAADFPFRKFLNPMEGLGELGSSDDRRGTAGMLRTQFTGVDAHADVDAGIDLDDPLFDVAGADALQITGRDAPTVIGAVFYHRLFWDGRANHFFNGRNVWGNADTSHPTVLERRADGSLGEIEVRLDNAALASQAVGPVLSDVEMSWLGRDWQDVGRKLLARAPLAEQRVDPTDSVLGSLARSGDKGLREGLTYGELVRAAFHERWWGASEQRGGYTQAEANFALFFGLSILCYEATLVPDQAPYDRWRAGDRTALTQREQEGLALFLGRGKCITCHDTPMFAGALRGEVINNEPEGEGLIERMVMANSLASGGLTFATTPGAGELPLGFNPYRKPVSLWSVEPPLLLATLALPSGQRCPPAGTTTWTLFPTSQISPLADFRGTVTMESDGACGSRLRVGFEWNAAGPGFYQYELEIGGLRFPFTIAPATRQAAYDNGFYNLALTPTSDDPGVGGRGPFGPLSITRRVQNGEDVGQETRGGPVAPGERVAVDGAFKTPTLRNVELTGPYMHDGSMASLEQVVEFYARGGDFSRENARDKDIDVAGFGMDPQEVADLVAFLRSLTDPRVRTAAAPFDHPELPLKVGHVGDERALAVDTLGNGLVELELLPATGAAGGAALPSFEERLAASITVRVVLENASVTRVAFVCDRRPTAPVRVRLMTTVKGASARDAGALPRLSASEVVFTPEDWRTTRTVDVVRSGTAGPLPLLLRTSAATSADPAFSGLAVDDVELDFIP